MLSILDILIPLLSDHHSINTQRLTGTGNNKIICFINKEHPSKLYSSLFLSSGCIVNNFKKQDGKSNDEGENMWISLLVFVFHDFIHKRITTVEKMLQVETMNHSVDVS